MAEPMVILIAQITLRGIKMDTCQRLNPSFSRELEHLMKKAPLYREKSNEYLSQVKPIIFSCPIFPPIFLYFYQKKDGSLGWTGPDFDDQRGLGV